MSPAPELVAMIQAAPRVWIGTHVDPDGDAFGSLLGLGGILAAMGKAVSLACQDPAPREVDFLPGLEHVGSRPPLEGELAIAVDAADEARLGLLHEPGRWSSLASVVIDHHRSNPGFGTVNWIEPQAASTAEMIAELAGAAGWPIGPAEATCLLTGIVADTLGFRTGNTRAESLHRAEGLMRRGADLSDISAKLFGRQSLAGLKLIGLAIGRLEMHGSLGLTWLSEADFTAVGAGAGDGREVSRVLSTAAEPAAIAVLRDRGDGHVDVSMRAKKGIDLVPAAVALGGGGHPQAAGARLTMELGMARRRVLEATRACLPDPAMPSEAAAMPGEPDGEPTGGGA